MLGEKHIRARWRRRWWDGDTHYFGKLDERLEYIESILEDINDLINSESENTNIETAISNLKQRKLMMRKSVLEDVNEVINSESENTYIETAKPNLKQCKLMMRKNFLLPDLTLLLNE